ncbi:hypothetical protein [Myxacorys almedinensis]|uniref:Uncharacterized protein n=1 Tax=Myxacorys almedinensis A TaxID=2690445 RepID=A0A8J7YWT6_9CYAN|nr:hypothetical protein [Myxacorys almedinensis]NDJ16092.1 hypothetical protein [Myxacorys almedinensis A]
MTGCDSIFRNKPLLTVSLRSSCRVIFAPQSQRHEPLSCLPWLGKIALGQVAFWVGLGMPSSAWSAPIPMAPQIPQSGAAALGTLEVRLAPPSAPESREAGFREAVAARPAPAHRWLTTDRTVQEPPSDALPSAIAGNASSPDLARPLVPPLASSATLSPPSGERFALEPDQRDGSASFNQTRIVGQGILKQRLQHPTRPAPCWQSLPTAPSFGVLPSESRCSFQPGQAQLNPINAQAASLSVAQSLDSGDPELGILRIEPEIDRPTNELGTLRVAPELGQTDELGTLRVVPEPETDELGAIEQGLNAQSIDGAADPELGTLRLQEDTVPQLPTLPAAPKPASVFLLSRIDYFRTTNVFSGVDPVDDGLIRAGATLFYAPRLGPKTFLVTSIDTNLIRYTSLGSTRPGSGGFLNYDELRFRAGVFHQLTSRMSGEIGWSNQQLFNAKEGLRSFFSGDRFLNDHALRIELSRRDPIAPKLTLNTFYQFRLSFADPNDRSRLINSLTASLSYDVTPKLQTAIDYQVAWSHFTQQSRDDLFNQIVGRLSYALNRSSQVNVFTGFSFGNSSDRRIDFNGFIFGAGLVFNLPLF